MAFIVEPVVQPGFSKDLAKLKWRTCLALISLCSMCLALHIMHILLVPVVGVRLWIDIVLAACLGALNILLISMHRSTGRWYIALPLYVFALTEASVALWSWTSQSRSKDIAVYSSAFALLAIAASLSVTLPLRNTDLSLNGIATRGSVPSSGNRSPEDNLTLGQWMTASWIAPVLAMAKKRQLNDSDVWQLPYEFQHTHLYMAFRSLKGGILYRLILANVTDLWLLSILGLMELAGRYAVPVLLQQLLRALEASPRETRKAVAIAVGTFTLRYTVVQVGVFSLWFGRRCYERSRGELITMLYEKTLNRKILSTTEAIKTSRKVPQGNGDVESEQTPLLSNGRSALKSQNLSAWQKWRAWFNRSQGPSSLSPALPTTSGKLLNLMRNDVYEVAQRFWEVQSILNKPIGLALSILLTVNLMGWSAMIGLGVVIIGQTLNAILAKIIIGWEKKRRAATDRRVQETSQYIEILRHLRWYGQHHRWISKVFAARQRELNLRIITFVLQSFIQLFNELSARFLPVTAFWAYTVLAKEELRVDIAFPALQLFLLLQRDLQDLPNLITTLINASIAMGRIQTFMDEPNKEEDGGVSHNVNQTLELCEASFAWPGLHVPVLNTLSLSFHSGLNVVYGPVGSGKTALLQAILGELDLISGTVGCPNGAIGYCAQLPWLQSMTIRENILFTKPFEPNRYHDVIGICQLHEDFKSFEKGDLSPIGENGIGLSGGQKARIALARALYSDTKLLLLDDPLSALDHHTAEDVVHGVLEDTKRHSRITILATHRIDICEHLAIQAIKMANGSAKIINRHTGKLALGDSADDRSESRGLHYSFTPNDLSNKQLISEDRFEEVEHRKEGRIKAGIYWKYVKAGGLPSWALVLSMSVILRAFILANNWIIKELGEAYNRPSASLTTHLSTPSFLEKIQSAWREYFDDYPNPSVDVIPWLRLLSIVVLLQSIAVQIVAWTQLLVQYNAGRRLFRQVLQRVSEAKFRFYDVTPVGRLLNRLTSDIGVVDSNVSRQLDYITFQGFAWIASLVVIASATPAFLLVTALATLGFVLVFRQGLPASQSLRRLEMASLSPLFSNFGSLVQGLITVRAFKAQTQFQNTVIAVTDTFQRMDHFYWSCQTWVIYRFDLISASATLFLTLLAIWSDLSAGLTAFLLTVANKFIQATHDMCKCYGAMQLDFVSVERAIELLDVEQEDAGTMDPSAAWPSASDDIVMENVTIRYAPHFPPALTNVSLRIRGGKTTAITGRTGSGKSTLALALLATVPAPEQGTIHIGAMDVNKVSKQALRTRITFLAQEPVLFPGTLRENLDATGETYTDEECASALSAINGDRKFGWTLATKIEAGGHNLSQGQRQLISIARAILRRSNLVIMDEATASIDLETSAELVKLLREKMPEVTLVVIAHRKGVIEEADEVIELSKGGVVTT